MDPSTFEFGYVQHFLCKGLLSFKMEVLSRLGTTIEACLEMILVGFGLKQIVVCS
jgi:hypothetical protein